MTDKKSDISQQLMSAKNPHLYKFAQFLRGMAAQDKEFSARLVLSARTIEMYIRNSDKLVLTYPDLVTQYWGKWALSRV